MVPDADDQVDGPATDALGKEIVAAVPLDPLGQGVIAMTAPADPAPTTM
jgi:hypothetical protein